MTSEELLKLADERYPNRDRSLDEFCRQRLFVYAADETEADGKRHLATLQGDQSVVGLMAKHSFPPSSPERQRENLDSLCNGGV